MEKPEILQVLNSVVRSVLDDEDIDFNEDTLIRDVPEWDSLNNMYIVTRIEKKLGLDFQQSDFRDVASVGQIVELVSSRLRK
jgi:acyl carrier protein